ncbi:MAG: exosortase/archaeosortase family protein [Candidatus Micrarchaeota archaeon]
MKRFCLKGLEKDLKKGLKFLFFFFLFSALACVVFFFTPLNFETQKIVAETSAFLLTSTGINTTYIESNPPHLIGEGFNAEINEVCSGGIEIIVLFGIIFASFEKTWKERMNGFLIGLILLIALNFFRIVATLHFLSEFMHSFLFRITLIIAIVGYYWYWFYEPTVFKRVFSNNQS